LTYFLRFKDNVKKLSAIFQDQPDKALDRAVYWTEYVLRHKGIFRAFISSLLEKRILKSVPRCLFTGAVHLRSAARDLTFIQYHSLDALAVLIGGLGIALYIVFAILRFLCNLICGFSKKSASSDKKKRD
jgi:glucuronosyltransferase